MKKSPVVEMNSLRRLKRVISFGVLAFGASSITISHAMALEDNALPSGGVVVGGSATIDYAVTDTVNVYQASDRAVINWNSFNIGANATAQFHQPSASAIVVNRVTGDHQDPTQILGSLKANGTVFVMDKNGVIFGENSTVDVGSVVVSTGTIDDNAFMGGSNVISIQNENSNAAIINKGNITVAEAGLAAFVAPTLVNQGVIQAKTGRVALASGTKATIDLYGDKLVELATDLPLDHASITNAGTIRSEGGTVLITASAARNIVDNVINTSGIIDVSSVTQVGGKIILEGANAEVSGTLDASGKTGGGSINVGGGYQGSGNIRHADNVSVTNPGIIKANASGATGNGGDVIIWSDNTTKFDGAIEARGGSSSGNGGRVETSGKINLGVSGTVDASAANGKNGEWLLDPSNVIISGSGGTAIPTTGGTVNPSTDSYTISAASIQTALNNGNNVKITTTNAGGTEAGDITTSGTVSINKSSGIGASLTLQADRNINLSNTTISSSSGALNVILNADSDANQDGSISLTSSALTTNGGYFVAGGGAGTLGGTNGILGDGDGTGADDVAAFNNTLDGITLDGTTVNTGSGNIFIKGQGQRKGLWIGNASALTTTGAGNISINGKVDNVSGTQAFTYGVDIRDTSMIKVQTGNLNIAGYGSGGTTTTLGVALQGTTGVLESTTGTINITGQIASGSNRADFYGTAASTIRSTNGGNINIIANSMLGDLSTISTTGTVTFKPRTSATTIGLGGGTGTLSINDTMLANITAGKLVIGDSVAGSGDIDLDSWDMSAKTFDVEVYGNDIDIGGLTLGTGNFLAHAMDAGADLGTLTISAAMTKSLAGTSSLTLRADKDIVFSSSSNITASGSAILNMVLNSDRDADHDGAINITSSTITTNGGYAVLGGGSGNIDSDANGILGDGGTGADFAQAYGSSAYVVGVNLSTSSTLTTNGGNVYINGQGANLSSDANGGVYLNSAIQTGSGSVNIHGTAAGNTASTNDYGFQSGSTGSITTTSGAINIIGDNNTTGTGAGAYGIFAAGNIISDSGAITLIGTSGVPSGGNNIGFRMNNGIIRSGSNALSITGIGTTADFNLSGGTIGGIGQLGTITLNANTFANSGTSISSDNKTIIKPRTASTTIGLGGGAGTLGIDDSELAYFGGGTLVIGDSVSGTGDIDLDSWNLSAKTHNVELYGNDIDIGGLTLGTGNFLAHAMDAGADLGTLTMSAATTKSLAGTSSLTLRADRDIVFSSGANITTTTGALNTILNADRDADQDGAINITSSAITTNGGYFVAGGGAGALGGTNGILGDGDGTGADDVAAWGNGTYKAGATLNNGDISTGAGAIILHGHGQNDSATDAQYGINLYNGSVLQTVTGDINLVGVGGNGNNDNDGLVINSTSEINSEKGTIRLVGTGGNSGAGTGSNSDGVVIYNSSKVSSTGTGSDAAKIYITGTGTGSDTGNNGFVIGYSTITSQKGDIEITGMGANTAFSRGIYFNGAGKIESTGSANIKLTGNSNTDFLLYSYAGEDKIIGGANDTGAITLVGNTFDFQAGTNIQTSGAALFKPRTASTSIGLGGGTGTLNLNDAELALLNVGKLIVGDSVSGSGDIDLDSWNLSAKTYDVELYGNDIDIGGLTLGTGNFLAHAMDAGADFGTLTMSAATTKSLAGTSSLTLRADKDIIFNSGSNITTTNGLLNILLNADRDADQDGAVRLTSSAITTNDGYFVAGGGAGVLGGTNGILGDGDGTGADDVSTYATGSNGYGVNIAASNIQTGAGSIILTGSGGSAANQSGVIIETSTVRNTSGHILVKGTGGSAITLGASGVYLSYSTIQSDSGNIDLYGYAKGTGDSINIDRAILLNTSTIKTTTDVDELGNIYLYGDANLSTATERRGIEIAWTSLVQTRAGDISVIGTNANNQGITFYRDNRVESLNGGDIHLNSGLKKILFASDSSSNRATIGNATTNLIDIVSDIFELDGYSSAMPQIIADTVSIKPYTANTTIGIGGGTGTLNIDDSELARINATTKLIIGNSVNGTGDVDLDSWNLSAKPYNVEIYGNDIDIGGLTLGSGNFLAHAMDAGADLGTLTFSAATTKSLAGTSSLTLRADRDIVFSSGANITATTGALNTILNADRDADHDGAINITTSAITTNGGYVVMGGGSGTLGGTNGILGDGDGTGADDVAAWGNATYVSGVQLNNGDLDTLTGGIYLTGHGVDSASITGSHNGARILSGSVLSATSGAIKIIGAGGIGASGQDNGISVLTSSELKTQNGNITLTGTGGGGSSSDSVGVSVGNNAKIAASGTGKISISASSTTGSGAGLSGFIIGSGSSVSVKDGDLEITGTGLASDIFSRGIFFNGSGDIVSTGLGKITLTANAYLDFYTYDYGGNIFNIGNTLTQADITLNGNTFTLATGTSIKTTGTVFVTPRTASTTIGLGGGTGTLNLNDAELGYFDAGTVVIGDSVFGSGDVNIQTWDLSAKSHVVQVFGKNVDLAGITLGAGDVMLYSNGGTFTVSADASYNASGDLNILGTGDILVNAALVNAGLGHVDLFAGWDGLSAISSPLTFDPAAVDLTTLAHNDIILGSAGRISGAAGGTSVLLAAGGDFVNNSSSGATAVSAASGGRALIYASDYASGTVKGGLTFKNLYNRPFNSTPPSSIGGTENYFVFATQPTLTLTADSLTGPDAAAASFSYTASGLVGGDLLSDVLSGTPTYTLGAPSGSNWPIQLSGGTLNSLAGYALSYTNGIFTQTGGGTLPPAVLAQPPQQVLINSGLINHVSNLIRVGVVNDKLPTFHQNTQILVSYNDPYGAISVDGSGVYYQTAPEDMTIQNDNLNILKTEAGPLQPVSCLASDGITGGCLIP